MSITETPSVTKPRRRQARPEQVGLVIERVENLTLEIRNAAAITQLIDGLDRRLALLEEGMPSIGMVAAQSGRLARLEEQARNGGNGHSGS
jgi:hypothetical protein